MTNAQMMLFLVIFLSFLACTNDLKQVEEYVDDCSIAKRDIPAARQTFKSTRNPGCATGCVTDGEVLQLLMTATGCSSIAVIADEATPSDTSEINTGVPRIASTSRGGTTVRMERPETKTTAFRLPSVALYIEASGSMYPYLNGESDLKDDVAEVIQALSSPLAPVAETLTTGYLQQETKRFDGDPIDFASSLTVDNLRNAGGSSSNISQLIARTLKESQGGVSVLISDLVFSPGNGKSAEEYLSKQRRALQRLMATQLADDDRFAVAIIAVEAEDFSGAYYDHNNAKTNYSDSRPYYYFVGGRNPGVRRVAEAIEAATGGTAITFAKGGASIEYAIAAADKSMGYGDYEVRDQLMPVVVTDAEAARGGSHRGILRLAISTDLGSLALTEAQLGDASTISASGKWEVASISSLGSQLLPYTHELLLDYSGDPYPSDVLVSFPAVTSQSLAMRYFAEGTVDEGDPSAFAGRTYGLRQLVQGIDNAYAKTSSADTPAGSFTFQIK